MGTSPDDTFPVIVIGASAGGIQAISDILSSLPEEFPAAIAIVQHRSIQPGFLAEVLSRRSGRAVRDAEEGDHLTPDCVFLAPADKHLLINPDASLSLSGSLKIRSSRPAADVLFTSGAESLGSRLIAVVLTGGDSDGMDGVRAVHRAGGWVIVQDPATAETPGMPVSALTTGCVDAMLLLDEIGPALLRLVEDDDRSKNREYWN